MSKTREIWWAYAKAMIKVYPQRKAEYAALHTQTVTADLSGMPRGGGASRSTELIAMRELSPTKQKEYDAVRKAINITKRRKNGRDRLKVIEMVYWKQSKTIAGAAMMIPCHQRTAEQYHREFVYLVGKCYGLLDEK